MTKLYKLNQTKRTLLKTTIVLVTLLNSFSLSAQDEILFERDFDTEHESDEKVGYFLLEQGVQGNCANLDGLTSYLQIPVKEFKSPNDEFTIQAWVALQEYPWNWSAIIDNYKDNTGIFFGISAEGKLGLFLGDGKKEVRCISDSSIPHLYWNHVAATVNIENGITLYMNGEKAGHTKLKGEINLQSKENIRIGRSHVDTYPYGTEREVCMQYNSKMILDGLLDEVKIYASAFDEEQIKNLYKRIDLDNNKPLEWRRIPKGPVNLPDRFAAYYTRLNYDDEWERLWRVAEHPDVLITFEDSPVRVFFWRGINYGPTWVTENDIFTSNQSMEYYTDESGCNEHMADKQCRYSHVRIIEKNDARIVVHWRYALTSVAYDFPEFDTTTNWGDWGDEYYYIYPDGVTVRKQILHSHRFTQTWRDDISDGQYTHYQFNEMFVFSQPGHSPYEIIENGGLTHATLDGKKRTFYIDKENDENLEDALIKVVNTKSDNKLFAIFESGTRVESWIEDGYFTWNHWPVSQLPSDGRFSTANDRPAHTALSNAAPVVKKDDIHYTAVSLYGMNAMNVDDLIVLGNSWNFPCDAGTEGTQLEFMGYDKYERAFVFENKDPEQFNESKISFLANESSPFFNNAVIIKNVQDTHYTISGDAEDIQIRHDIVHTMRGNDLIIWLGIQTREAFRLKISGSM